MFWFWGPEPGWLFGLLSGLFWIAVIVAAVLLLRREVPHLRWPPGGSAALRILEERYARGEISREEFLQRRSVLLSAGREPGPATPAMPPAPPPARTGAEPPPPPDRAVGPTGTGPAAQAEDPTQPLPEKRRPGRGQAP